MANSIFFKTLSKSIYTSSMIKGGGQDGLKRRVVVKMVLNAKITDPKYL